MKLIVPFSCIDHLRSYYVHFSVSVCLCIYLSLSLKWAIFITFSYFLKYM